MPDAEGVRYVPAGMRLLFGEPARDPKLHLSGVNESERREAGKFSIEFRGVAYFPGTAHR